MNRLAKKRWLDILAPYLFVLPFLVSFVFFFVFPSLYSIVLSFFKYRGYGPMTFVGFGNYRSIFVYPTFWKSVTNTLFYWIAHIIPVMTVSFLLAVMLNSKLMRARNIYKTLIFLPQVMSLVAASLIFKVLFATRTGVINTILGTQIPFMESAGLAKWTVIAFIFWRSIGWWMVIFCAGLTTVNPELLEAAMADGANAPQRLARITIPLMRPIFLFAFLTDTISTFKIFTEPTLILGNATSLSSQPHVTPIVGILVSSLNGGQFGMASAYGWVLFLIIFIVSLIQLRVVRGGDESEA